MAAIRRSTAVSKRKLPIPPPPQPRINGKYAAKPKLPTEQSLALTVLPKKLVPVAATAALDPTMNDAISAMWERASEFSSPAAAILAGIALNPAAREMFDEAMDQMWAVQPMPTSSRNEVIIGAGYNAAVYCAVRAQMGYPKPIVLERRERVGGVFAISRGPSFYLNSRNRPGEAALPGQPGALNYIPGAILQPSDIGGGEYQTNDELAWVIRVALAMFGVVVPNSEVSELLLSAPFPQINTRLSDGRKLLVGRAIVATGLNNPRELIPFDSERVLSFEQFMAKMDSPFPLRGLKRVAVVGGGNAAMNVIEALTGQGPTRSMSVAAVDYPQQIDWYGIPQASRQSWEKKCRSRYQGIARLLPNDTTRNEGLRSFRVNPFAGVSPAVSKGYKVAYVGEKAYDCVVVCIGYIARSTLPILEGELYAVGARNVGRKSGSIYTIGPAATVGLSAQETFLGSIPDNVVSMFRYGPRTADLAASLPA